jgi:Flp pilus assembly protein TadD
MNTHRAALILASLALLSCARTVQERTVRAPAPAPVTGVRATMQRQVMNAVDAGEGDLRVKELRARLIADPDNLEARIALASHYASAGFPEIAIEHYRLAALRRPDDARVAVLLARSLHRVGASLEARAHLEAFVARYPAAGADVWSWTGILQDATREYAAGERSHRAALQRQPNSSALHNNLGYNLLLQGRNAEAVQALKQALALEPASALARSNLGIAVAERPAEAVDAFASVTDPASAHNNLGAVLLERGDLPGARREFETALGYNSRHTAALGNLQLVAEADGAGIGLPAGSQTAWQRFVRTLGVVLLGSEPEPKTKDPASAAGKQHAAPQVGAVN